MMKKTIALPILLLLVLAVPAATVFLSGCNKAASGHVDHAATKWTCPMHAEIVRDEPGNCPICGMKLVPVEAAKLDAAAAGPADRATITIDP